MKDDQDRLGEGEVRESGVDMVGHSSLVVTVGVSYMFRDGERGEVPVILFSLKWRQICYCCVYLNSLVIVWSRWWDDQDHTCLAASFSCESGIHLSLAALVFLNTLKSQGHIPDRWVKWEDIVQHG